MLASRGFGDKWIFWISNIVRGGSICAMTKIVPILNRGKALSRDPLAPLLFNLLADVYTRTLNKAVNCDLQPDRWGWLGWPAPSHEYCSSEPASSTSLSHKRTSNDTNQPIEQAEEA